jgi:flagellar hook assembly protein FlgD
VNSLQAVYPNPIDGEAWMRFNLDRQAEVILEITDLQGRQLVLLHSGSLDAGSHRFRWDGKNAAGSRLASGVYLVRLSAASVQSVQRVLVK